MPGAGAPVAGRPGRPGRVAVEDPEDPRLADYRELKDPARQRREAERGVFVVEGRLAVAGLLGSPYEVLSLLVDERRARRDEALVEAVVAAGAPAYVGTRDVLRRTVGFDLHRGVVALGRRPAPEHGPTVARRVLEEAAGAGRRAVLVVAEGLNDHENLGALFRNAAALGAGAVLLDATCADPLYRRAVRVSLGQVLAVPFARLERWPGGLEELASLGYRLAALAPDHGRHGQHGPDGPDRPRSDLRPWAAARAVTPAVALVLGAEGPGLSPGALEAAGEAVAIPMTRRVDSLNVATAAAIALYELAASWPATPPAGGATRGPVPS